jgi:hypothetical protein
MLALVELMALNSDYAERTGETDFSLKINRVAAIPGGVC